MFLTSSVLLSSLLFLGVLCTPLTPRWDDLVEKHAWAEIPPGWEYHSTPSPDHVFEMRIGLKQDKIDQLISMLYEISDPSHASYGNHLSKEETDALVAPHPDSVESVETWLLHHNINAEDATFRSSAGEWLTFPVTVAQAEAMLGAKYQVYRHTASSSYVVRTLSYSLPRHLHGHVDLIAPTTYFGTMRSMKATNFIQGFVDTDEEDPIDLNDFLNPLAVPPASCATAITPSCLKILYNTVNYTPQAANRNTLGVAGYLDEFANRADLQTFFRTFLPAAVGANFTTVRVANGGDDQNDPGVEANLDIQYTEGMSFPTPNIYYSTGGSPPFIPDSQTPTNTNEPYLDWLNFIMAQSTVPQTFTTSYGDDEQTVPSDYATSVCNLFAQLGARGSSVLFSSGDFGVGGGDCRTNDGTNTVLFQPAFPASCPFVTAVGGTININPETAVSFSGGGFSRLFSTPSYQAAAVANYTARIGTQFAGLFNAAGRAYPDVAAQGQNFRVILGGRTISVGGTSASSPTVAGVISLLNDFRLANGQSSLGFLNPLIYANPQGFNDITSGRNPGCGTNGFSALAGWDPVTGLGTPDFLKLQTIVS
ncbi:subtilisin-like protein [Mucidula mucida]|nr:subtilisin-like protein [Mucidula mucida]